MHAPEAGTAPANVGSCKSAAAFLADLGRWAGRQFADTLRPIGLKPRHLGALLALRAGPLSQQDLGDVMGLDAAQLVGVLNELEREELVVRRRDPDDRRRHFVDISETGRERLTTADRAAADIDRRLLAGLTPADQLRFTELLRRVAEHHASDAPQPCSSESDC
jgi:DNA-binding MarR family transcriptional regulator